MDSASLDTSETEAIASRGAARPSSHESVREAGGVRWVERGSSRRLVFETLSGRSWGALLVCVSAAWGWAALRWSFGAAGYAEMAILAVLGISRLASRTCIVVGDGRIHCKAGLGWMAPPISERSADIDDVVVEPRGPLDERCWSLHLLTRDHRKLPLGLGHDAASLAFGSEEGARVLRERLLSALRRSHGDATITRRVTDG